MEIKQSYNKLSSLRKKRHDVDTIDVIIIEKCGSLFLVIAFVSTLSQYVGTKINCAIPQTLPGAWFKYINTSCWFNGTYYWPLEEPLASINQYQQMENTIQTYRYFAYFPLFYIIMAAFIFAPDVFWRIMSNRSGIGFSKLLMTLNEAQKQFDGSNSENIIDNLSFCFYRHALMSKLYRHQRYGRYFILRQIDYLDSRTGTYLTYNFLIKKYLYIVSFVSIIIYLNVVFHNRFTTLGFDFLYRVFHIPYEQSRLFPLYVLCDLKTTFLSITSYTFQCIIARNIFMDGFITMTWFLIAGGLILAIYSAIESTIDLCLGSKRLKFVCQNMIDFQSEIDKLEDKYRITRKKDEIDIFVRLNLNPDIIFILQMISKKNIHAKFTINRILNNLWLNSERFKEDFERKKKQLDDKVQKKHKIKLLESSSQSTEESEISDKAFYDE